MHDHRFEYLLRLADNALILSQRLSEWCGKGPVLEEDMAMTNVALDLIGQARQWLAYAGELDPAGRDEDTLAFLRDAHEFRNLLLVEQPNGTYADTIARQFYFDAWHFLLLRGLVGSSDSRMGAIAEKSLKEAAYHARRSADLVVRLGDGTDLSRSMIQESLDGLWMYTGEMFAYDPIVAAMSEAGIATLPAALQTPWMIHVRSVLDEAGLTMPSPDTWMQHGGLRGVHSEHLGYLLAEMQFLQRTHPGAQW